MADSNDELLFNNAYCERVKAARLARGWTAEQMATVLAIPPDRYRKYEVRSPLPAYLVERFCLAADIELYYLMTGKKPGISAPPVKANWMRA